MSTEQEEIDKVLSGYEDNITNGDNEGLAEGDELQLEQEKDGEADAKGAEDTGHMDYEQWIAAGKNPDKYRGKEAFNDYGEAINAIKDLKNQVTNQYTQFDETVNVLKNQYQTEANEKVETARATLLAEIEEAKGNDDVEAALAARDKLDNIKPVENAATAPTHNPAIVEFTQKNPIIDQSKPDFDKDFYADMTMIQGTIIERMTGNNQDRLNALTPEQIARSMNIAYQQTKEMHPDKFKSPRNSRTATTTRTTAKRQTSNPDYVTRLKGMTTNTMNKHDTSATLDMYNLLKQSDQKAADDYAKAILGDK